MSANRPESTDLVKVEPLGSDVQIGPGSSVVLSGRAGAGVADAVGHTAKGGLKLLRRQQAASSYRLVPSPELRKGLAKGTLRFATPGSGDASTLIKGVDGKIAGRADLMKVRGVVSTLGPVAWQALALATQQHFLAEINNKLEGIEKGVDEILATLTDDRIGTLKDLSEKAADSQALLDRGGSLSSARVEELRHGARDAKRLWHQTESTARRKLSEYENGATTASAAGEAYAMFAQATKVLAECSAVLTAVPQSSTEALNAAYEDERDRVHPALEEFEELTEKFVNASESWAQDHADYVARAPQGRFKRNWNRVPIEPLHFGRKKPAQEALPGRTVDRLRRLTPKQSLPSGILVEVSPEGTVRLATDQGTTQK